MQEFFFIVLGLIGLWLGTELVIKGALSIANYFELSQVFIGIAILAIGTDLPEIVISITASLQNLSVGVDASGLIIGNAIGSSISQISIVLGVAGLMGYLTLSKRHIFEDGTMLIGSVVLVSLLGYDGKITRVEGIVLMVVYLIYYITIFYKEKIAEKIKKEFNPDLYKDFVYLVMGMVLVIFSSDFVVNNALSFSESLGIEQSFVGIIIIGLGTSLPELALSINAMRKSATGLSVGNIIGSNIFDMLMPMGIGASISELSFEKSLVWFDLPFLFILSIIVFRFFNRKKGLQKMEAIVLIILFIAYAILKFIGL